VLLAVLVAALLWALAVALLAKAAAAVVRRSGVEPGAALVWLGLAEWPPEGPPLPERRRVRLVEPAPPARVARPGL
jgi:hypothetical protein